MLSRCDSYCSIRHTTLDFVGCVFDPIETVHGCDCLPAPRNLPKTSICYSFSHLFLADAQRANGQIDAACKEWQLMLDLPSEYPEYNSAKKEATQRLSEYRSSSPDRHRKRWLP